jgi:hypothetical protein
MAQLKLNPPEETADKIRSKAAKLGVSTNAFLAPFLDAIADGRLILQPYYPPPGQVGK